jgi:hypothetical protein
MQLKPNAKVTWTQGLKELQTYLVSPDWGSPSELIIVIDFLHNRTLIFIYAFSASSMLALLTIGVLCIPFFFLQKRALL